MQEPEPINSTTIASTAAEDKSARHEHLEGSKVSQSATESYKHSEQETELDVLSTRADEALNGFDKADRALYFSNSGKHSGIQVELCRKVQPVYEQEALGFLSLTSIKKGEKNVWNARIDRSEFGQHFLKPWERAEEEITKWKTTYRTELDGDTDLTEKVNALHDSVKEMISTRKGLESFFEKHGRFTEATQAPLPSLTRLSER